MKLKIKNFMKFAFRGNRDFMRNKSEKSFLIKLENTQVAFSKLEMFFSLDLPVTKNQI